MRLVVAGRPRGSIPKQIAAVILAVAAIFAIAAVVYRESSLIRDPFVDQRTRARGAATTAEVLVLGDSRAAHAFYHGSMDDRFLSLGHFGEKPAGTLARVIEANRTMPNLKAIAVQVDGYRFSRGAELREDYGEQLSAGELSAYFDMPFSRIVTVTLTAVMPLVQPDRRRLFLAGLVKKIVTTTNSDVSSGGRYFDACLELAYPPTGREVERRYSDVDPATIDGLVEWEMMFKYRNARIDPVAVKAFRHIAEIAHARGIRVYGVRLPVLRKWNELLAQEGMLEIESMANRLGYDDILDYSAIFSDRLELFQDADHLNRQGGRMFSALLADDLRKRMRLPDAPPQRCAKFGSAPAS